MVLFACSVPGKASACAASFAPKSIEVLENESTDYYDLLSGEEAESDFEVRTEDCQALRGVSLEGEAIYRTSSRTYAIPRPPS